MLRISTLHRLKYLLPYYSIRSISKFAGIIESESCKQYCNGIIEKFNSIKTGGTESLADGTERDEISRWQRISQIYQHLQAKDDELKQLKEMENENNDNELKTVIEEDIHNINSTIDELYDELAFAIVPQSDLDVLSKCQLEFTAGAGGAESMIFAEEIFELYRRHAEYKGWNWEAIQHETVSSGGLRSALVLLEGQACYSYMRFEAGIHRVQRVPFNAKIVHTSTISLTVLPEPENAELIIPPNEIKLETMRASGPGGQNVNTRSTACRLTHLPSGTSVHVMEERFQHMNIQIAHKRLAAILLQRKVDELNSKTTSARKLQFGSRARAEKIRTFNFKDDRITDHRLKLNLHHIDGFLKGGPSLDIFMEELRYLDLTERLQEIVNDNS